MLVTQLDNLCHIDTRTSNRHHISPLSDVGQCAVTLFTFHGELRGGTITLPAAGQFPAHGLLDPLKLLPQEAQIVSNCTLPSYQNAPSSSPAQGAQGKARHTYTALFYFPEIPRRRYFGHSALALLRTSHGHNHLLDLPPF